MLNKLLKHELKATSNYLIPMYLVLLLLSILDRIVLTLDIFPGTLAIIPGLITVAYVLSIIAMVVITFVLMVLRFYKNLLSDEGYLMFTLPVKTKHLVSSKLLVSILWTILSIIAVIVSLLIVFATPERMHEFWQELSLVWEELRLQFGSNTLLLTIEFAILMLVGISNTFLLIYLSIAVGHIFNSHKVLASFLSYIGISTLVQMTTTLILMTIAYFIEKSFQNLHDIPQIIFPTMIVVFLALNILYYFAVNQVFRRNLNLE
ncbi:MAG TPA: hypothetical protein VJ888_01215 [Mobilitalea sp.]|nr:hypothetical protein [Mobilitalea sp.]